MKTKENKNKKKIKTNSKTNYLNIIFIIISILIILLIFFLSLQPQKKSNSGIFNLNVSEFENINTIGINEFQASLEIDTLSIFFFCSNEEKKCYEELKILNDIAKENKLTIEYINVLELVDLEKEQLNNISNVFNEKYYPNLIISKDKEMKVNINEFSKRDEIIEIFKEYEII